MAAHDASGEIEPEPVEPSPAVAQPVPSRAADATPVRIEPGPVDLSPAVAQPVPSRAADATPARKAVRTARGLVTSPAVQGLAALAVYLAIWLTTEVSPLIAHPGWAQLDQASMDPNFYTWSLRWWPYAVGHGLNPLYTAEVNEPAGYDLAWVTSIPPLALLVSPLTVLAGPVVAFNLLVAASAPLSGWAAFVLCRRLTKRFWPALAGGAVYGFSAYEMNHSSAGQLNLSFSLLLPLMAYLAVLWWDKRISSPAFTLLLALAMALQFYLFLETFAGMTALWVIALVTGYALTGRPGRAAVARLSRLVGIAYLLAIAAAAGYLADALSRIPRGLLRSPAASSLDLASLVLPGRLFGASWLPVHAAAPQAGDGYAGIPLLLVAVALAITAWPRRITRWLLAVLLAVILAAAGPVLHVNGNPVTGFPWARLWDLPILHSAYPVRLMVFGFLALAVMTAIWLAGQPKWWLRWLLGLFVIAAIASHLPVLNLQRGPGLPAFITTGEYRRYLAPGQTVVVVSGSGNAGMLWQAETGFYTRLAGGYLNAATAHGTDLPLPVAGLGKGPLTRAEARTLRSFIKTARVAAILVETGSPWRWAERLGQYGLPGMCIGGVTLFRTLEAGRYPAGGEWPILPIRGSPPAGTPPTPPVYACAGPAGS